MGETILSSKDRLWLGFVCSVLAFAVEGLGSSKGNSFVLLENAGIGIVETILLFFNIRGISLDEEGRGSAGLRWANWSDYILLVVISGIITKSLIHLNNGGSNEVVGGWTTFCALVAICLELAGTRLCSGCEPNLQSARLKMYVGLTMNCCAIISVVVYNLTQIRVLDLWLTVLSGMIVGGIALVSIRDRRPVVEPVDVFPPEI